MILIFLRWLTRKLAYFWLVWQGWVLTWEWQAKR